VATEHRTPTIHDVARRAGVSIATVSRVLNGPREARSETIERVREAAASLGYRAATPARALRDGHAPVLGVVHNQDSCGPTLQHPFFARVLDGFASVVGAAGYDMLFPTAERRSHHFLAHARQNRLAGVLVLGDTGDEEIEELVRAELPVVCVDLQVEGSNAGCITSTNLEGAGLAVRHLHALGHERIATVTGDPGTLAADERLRGYREAMAALGLPVRERWVLRGRFDTATGKAALPQLLACPERPTAVFAGSDMIASGLLDAALDLGVDVPRDLAVVGFDDLDFAERTQPPLTTIRQQRFRLGQAAGALLVEMVPAPAARATTVRVPVELVVRTSCGAAG
jgi:LacI family transcriptional regulator